MAGLAEKEKVEVRDKDVAAKTSTPLIAAARKLMAADDVLAAAKKAVTRANIAYDLAEKQLVDQMVVENVRAFRTANHGLFYSQIRVFPNIVNKEELEKFVKKHKKTHFLWTTSINSAKLGSYLRELMENSKAIPPGVDPVLKTVIRRRAK